MDTVVYTDEDFVIAYKNHGIPTVPLKNQSGCMTLLGKVGLVFPEVLTVNGKNPWEGGALHRLDTDTSGLVVFARNDKFYRFLSDIQKKGNFIKIYVAETDGDSLDDCVVSTYFRAFGAGRKLVKAETDIKKSDNGILYSTSVEKTGKCKYTCTITNGFRHQIRVHLASNGCPIRNDRLYNPRFIDGELQLECVSVSWENFTYTVR